MKNVTIMLPADPARWLRVRSAEDDRSVSGSVVSFLHDRAGFVDINVYRHDGSDPSKQ